MSATRNVTIRCDEPGCLNCCETGEADTRGARRQAEREGWKTVESFQRDLCPQHLPQPKKLTPSEHAEVTEFKKATRKGEVRLCSICEEPQKVTPSGVTCPNGHGGASSKS